MDKEREYKVTIKNFFGHLHTVDVHRFRVFCLCCKVGIPIQGLLYEYCYDYNAPTMTPIMPFKYFLEYLCDTFSAGMTYQGKSWTKEYQLSYWNKIKDQARMDSKLKALLDKVYTEVSEKGLDAVLKKKYLKRLYESYINEK